MSALCGSREIWSALAQAAIALQHICALAEQQLAVVPPKSFNVIDGGALYLMFPENTLHGFDATSGKRLAKAAIERRRLVPA